MKVWLARGGWFLLALPVALAWGELFTRVLLPQEVDSFLDILVADPVVGYLYEPGARKNERSRECDVPFEINSLGLRDREYDLEPTAAERALRVLMVGNSFTVSRGESLQNSLPKVLERHLQAAAADNGLGRRIEVVNAANAGYNARNYWGTYARWAPLFRPDVVAVGFVAGNEFKCDEESVRYLVDGGLVVRYRDGEQPRLKSRGLLYRARKWLASHSELYVLLRDFIYYGKLADKVRARFGAGENTGKEMLRPFLVPEPKLVSDGWDRAFDYVRRLRDETAADGVPLVLICIPSKLQVDEEHYRQLLRVAGVGESEVDRDQPSRRVAEFCAREGIPLLDPLPAIRERHRSEPTFFVFDHHWNRTGIEAAAPLLVRQWREAGLPPFAAPLAIAAEEARQDSEASARPAARRPKTGS